jgi:hypothetical protein
MDKYLKVEGHDGLVRDLSTGAVLNINKVEIERAKELKKQKLLEKENQQSINNRIESLESDVSEIKSLLLNLIEKL